MAKTASKSFLLSSFYSKSHHFSLFWCMLCTAPPARHFKFKQKYQQHGLSSRLSFHFLWLCYSTGNFNMPILYALTCRHYGNFLQISWAESNLCCFFPNVSTVKHRRWNFARKCFTAWRLPTTVQLAKLASMMKLPFLDVWYDWLLILNVTLRAAMLDMMKILVTVNVQKQPP